MALELYTTTRELGVSMELRQYTWRGHPLLMKPGRYRPEVCPSPQEPFRLRSGEGFSRSLEKGFMGKVPVVDYVEHLVESGAGYRTPQAVL